MKVRLIFTAVLLLVLCFVIALISCAGETDVSASVDLDAEGTPVSEDLYGLFLEDISFAGDGGLVSELVNNKSFEYEYDKTAYWRFSDQYDKTAYWRFSDLSATVNTDGGLNEKNPSYLSVSVSGEGSLRNLGYVEFFDDMTDNYNAEK